MAILKTDLTNSANLDPSIRQQNVIGQPKAEVGQKQGVNQVAGQVLQKEPDTAKKDANLQINGPKVQPISLKNFQFENHTSLAFKIIDKKFIITEQLPEKGNNVRRLLGPRAIRNDNPNQRHNFAHNMNEKDRKHLDGIEEIEYHYVENGQKVVRRFNRDQVEFHHYEKHEFDELMNEWLTNKAEFENNQKKKSKDEDKTTKSDPHQPKKKAGKTKNVRLTSRRISNVAVNAAKNDLRNKQAIITHAQHIRQMEQQQRERHKKKSDIDKQIIEKEQINRSIKQGIVIDESKKHHKKFKSA